jgi:hypothetical protein
LVNPFLFLYLIMQFHLGFQPAISFNKITHQDGVLLIGSCFSEHIGARLNDLKFNVHSNPFGIVFNPKSIAILLLSLIMLSVSCNYLTLFLKLYLRFLL